jgi:hypothetical protein
MDSKSVTRTGNEEYWEPVVPDPSDPRLKSNVPPPKMVVIRDGWFRTTITRKAAWELAREDRAREAAKKR